MTAIDPWRRQLFESIETAGLLPQPRRIRLDTGVPALAGRIDLEGQSVEIAINLDPLWTHQLPEFFLRAHDAFGLLPHIDPLGKICFLEHEGLIFDRRRPLDVIRECLAEVQRTLRDGITGANHQDFVTEFEVYWARLDNPLFALASFELTEPDQVTELVVASSPNASVLHIAHDATRIPHIRNTPSHSGPWSAFRALYLPLEAGSMLLPPQIDPPFWGADGVRRLLSYCSAANRDRLKRLLQKRSYTHQYMIIRLPRPDGEAAVFGVRFEALGDQHPLRSTDTPGAIRPLVLFRRDKPYLAQRGGAHLALADTRVLLIGCGAVGGHLAFELSRAGVEQMHLVDPDVLEPENTYRHVLGQPYWYRDKAVALKHAIRTQLPFSKAEAFVGTIEQFIGAHTLDLTTYDLIISAIGNPTSELAFNELVRCHVSGPPLIFTWVDPYGIGGHAVLTGVHDSTGCFECLYTASDPTEQLHNRASFAAPNQVFRRSMAGCSSLYTPYGSLDASQTAQLAARLALDVLSGRVQTNCLRSWKGDATDFTAQEFVLSARYSLSTDQLAQLETCSASDMCPICQAMHDEAPA